MRNTLIVGSGKSSRANIEALLDDYFYMNKKDVLVILPVVSAPSEGQIFAAQYTKDSGIQLLVSARQDVSLTGLPSATLVDAENPVAEVFANLQNSKDAVDILILWDDDDPACTEALAWAKKLGTQALDLTNGMIAITPADDLEVPAVVLIPEQESLKDDFVDVEDPDDDEDSEEYDTDELYEALATLVRFIAPMLVQEMEKYRK